MPDLKQNAGLECWVNNNSLLFNSVSLPPAMELLKSNLPELYDIEQLVLACSVVKFSNMQSSSERSHIRLIMCSVSKNFTTRNQVGAHEEKADDADEKFRETAPSDRSASSAFWLDDDVTSNSLCRSIHFCL